jgi:hypothetical protein
VRLSSIDCVLVWRTVVTFFFLEMPEPKQCPLFVSLKVMRQEASDVISMTLAPPSWSKIASAGHDASADTSVTCISLKFNWHMAVCFLMHVLYMYIYIFWMGGQARAAFTLMEWMSFWEEYTVRALEGCMSIDVRAPVVVVSHEQLGRDLVGTVRRLVDDLIQVGVNK